MKSEYVTYVRKKADLKEGAQMIFIKDLAPGRRKYDTKLVRAEVREDPAQLPDGDILWVRSETGYLHPEPWSITVSEVLPPHLPGQPWQDMFAALRGLH